MYFITTALIRYQTYKASIRAILIYINCMKWSSSVCQTTNSFLKPTMHYIILPIILFLTNIRETRIPTLMYLFCVSDLIKIFTPCSKCRYMYTVILMDYDAFMTVTVLYNDILLTVKMLLADSLVHRKIRWYIRFYITMLWRPFW